LQAYKHRKQVKFQEYNSIGEKTLRQGESGPWKILSGRPPVLATQMTEAIPCIKE
jgi:hypothetical protein